MGNSIFLHAKGVQLPADTDKAPSPNTVAEYSRVFVAIDGKYAGLLYLTDRPVIVDQSAWEAPLRKLDHEKLTEMQKLE